MDEWKTVIPGTGHTCGRSSQYKEEIHLFWMMKNIPLKALEQFPSDMHVAPKVHSDYTKELQTIQFQL